jgi:hypothetical protein
MKRGVLINTKSNQGVREIKQVGIHWSRQSSKMAVRLSALSAGHPLPPGRFLLLISVRG